MEAVDFGKIRMGSQKIQAASGSTGNTQLYHHQIESLFPHMSHETGKYFRVRWPEHRIFPKSGCRGSGCRIFLIAPEKNRVPRMLWFCQPVALAMLAIGDI